MGCNTSKESVQPVEGEEKTENKTENKAEDKVEAPTATPTPDNKEEIKEENDKDTDSNKDKESISKPSSLKPLTPPSSRSGERLSNHLAATTPEPPPCDDEDDEEEQAEAAVKIQAVFRGHQARREMKQAQQQPQEAEPTKEQLEAEFRADDVELCKAATTIQNSFRSHLKTKQDEGKEGEGEGSGAKKVEENKEEELDIDLTDPDLNKAATKIQASFRGHKVRKETEAEDEKH